MTYTSQNDLSAAAVEQAPSTVQKLKTLQRESTQRSKRVISILRTAFAETAAEFKDGREVISPLAKEVTAETVATVKEKSQQAADAVNQTWQQEADDKDMTERVIGLMRSLAQSAKIKLFPQLKDQAGKVDGVLRDRYGNQYENVKAKFNVVRAWYVAPNQTKPETVVNDQPKQPIAIEVDSEVVS
ncbi:MAG: hypothetical protein WA885_23540 [Phormidesmis sp.]